MNFFPLLISTNKGAMKLEISPNLRFVQRFKKSGTDADDSSRFRHANSAFDCVVKVLGVAT